MASARVSYLDNASTSHPKAPGLADAIRSYLDEVGASPSRGSHSLARAADTRMADAHAQVGELLGIRDRQHLAFTSNATHALNLIIKGVLHHGDHAVTTALEHNSVLRPLEQLRRAGTIEYDVVSCDRDGTIAVDAIAARMRPTTKLVAVNHGSNVIGKLIDVAPIATLCRERRVALLVDASQTAGFLDLDVDALGVDYLAFTGHKKLLGPSGTGGAYLRDPFAVDSLLQGGTGGNSNSLVHPEAPPFKFDAGTSNYLGIAGLATAVAYLHAIGLADVRRHELELTAYCIERLRRIPQVVLHAAGDLPIVSFDVTGHLPSDVGTFLDRDCGVMVRTGIHCAPLIHKAIGTFPNGTVRASFGFQSTQGDVDRLVDGIRFLCKRPSIVSL
jgi:cysteine desulfurase family protein